jgi:hypothetical protein
MTAVLSEVRFYVDESALGIGKTLTAARKDVIHVGHPLIPSVRTEFMMMNGCQLLRSEAWWQ